MSSEPFVPYSFNYPYMWLIDISISTLLKTVYNISQVRISESDKQLLRSLNKERLVYISNHPSTKEPFVTYYVANKMATRFCYMAGREIFDWGGGLLGTMLKNMGTYSVLEGTFDKESLKTTRKILAAEKGKLALFPEGEPTSNQNDTLFPFQPGVAQMAISALEDAKKVDKDANIYVLPAFVKYRMEGKSSEIKKDIEQSIQRLEKHLNMKYLHGTWVDRLILIGEQILSDFERKFSIKVDLDTSFNERFENFKHSVLDLIADKIELKKWNQEASVVEKLRKILSLYDSVHYSDSQKNISKKDVEWARNYCQKVYDFISIDSDYIRELPSAERIYDWIYRFEQELFGSFKLRPSYAVVRFAKPISLLDYYDDYKSNKKATLDLVMTRLRGEVESLMKDEIKKSTKLC